MGDLQCPARVYVAGVALAREAEQRLSHERVAAVYRLEGSPEAVRTQLEAIADRHRGEAVLVLGDASLMSAALGGIVSGWRVGDPLGAGTVRALEADADGWRLVR
ncbi:MAG: hypothetical protein ACOYBY_12640 [Dermatophilaceae bacterium]